MNRDILTAQADAHLREQEVRLSQAFDKGRRFERERIHEVDWSKLKRIVLSRSIIGSVIGCGIILAIAVGLSNL